MNFARKLPQYAVYWAPPSSDDTGQTVYADPVEIRCRWEDATEQQISKTGETWMAMAVVYHTHRTEEGGFLWLGKVSELTDASDPTLNENAARILKVEGVPSRRATQTLRASYL